jgi:DNA polymerase III delta prime subunit
MSGLDYTESAERELAEQWLNAELNRIWLVAERCLRQFQRVQLRPQPDHPSLAEVEGIFTARRAARGNKSTGAMDEGEIQGALNDVESGIAALRRMAPIGKLAENLNLRPLELETLVVSVAPHIDAPLGDVFTLLRGSPNRRGVDLALIAQLYRLKRTERIALLDAVDPERPLLSWRLVQIMSPESMEAYGSVNYRAIQPTFDVLSVLCGRGELSPALLRCSTMVRERPTLDDLVLDEPMRNHLQALCSAAQGAQQAGHLNEMPWIVLWGPRGIGKRTVAARLAAYTGRSLLTFNPAAVDPGTLDELLRRAQREALLRGAVLYLGPLVGEILNESARELAKRMVGYPGLVVFGVETMQPPRLKMDHHPLQEVEIKLPSEVARNALWERSIPEPARAPEIHLNTIARAFHLTPGEIIDTSVEALAISRLRAGGQVQHEDLRGGIDRRLRNELGELARRLYITSRWEDLVLPDDDLDRVREFISRSKFAHRVYEEWGFGGRIGYGKGMIALFSGPPGTGKTMLAGLIAIELDLDIYQVDLAQVVSKWVGETEKQLARVFDQAERAHAVLLFDEADSLFAKRTEVKTSNDRYGNLAVNYLLQRLESYTGVAILTTNKEAALDEALRRRLSLHLHLDVPKPPERERLWWSMMPSRAPSARNINFKALAKEYEITGGYIKNIALRAAFLAAAEGVPIHMGLLRRAAALEMEDMGRLVSRMGRQDVVGLGDTSAGPEGKPEGKADPAVSRHPAANFVEG